MALPRRRNSQVGKDWRAHYTIENPADVEAFIRRHPTVIPVLKQATDEITARFGQDVELILGHIVDPDDEPASDFLALDIRARLDDDEAYARRCRLDDEWWFDAIRDVAGLLTIDLALR